MRAIQPFFVLILIAALAGGAFLHAVIPHNDGDHDADHHGHEDHEAVIWDLLHGAVSHEEKKGFLLFAGLVFIVVSALPVLLRPWAGIPLRTLPRQGPYELEFLRRGRARHRAFG